MGLSLFLDEPVSKIVGQLAVDRLTLQRASLQIVSYFLLKKKLTEM